MDAEANIEKPKYYPVLDLLKFIAAVLVISIHIFPEGSTTESVGFDTSAGMLFAEAFVYALTRIAVPIFFFVSSFILFGKVERDPENKASYIKGFCLRVLFLYLFWYVVALPITIRDITGFISQGDTYNLIRYIVITLWKWAPRGFWFLVSSTLSVLLTSLTRTKKSLIILFVVAGLMYAYGCLNSSYFGLLTLSDDPFSKALYAVGSYMEFSFCPLQALLFVVLGKIFVLHGEFKIKGNIAFIILSFALMVGELFLTLNFGLCIYPDAFLSLPIFIFFFMNQILKIEVKNESFARVAKKLKKVGSFSYLFHIQFFYYLHWILDSIGHNVFREQIALLLIPYIGCVAICFGLQTLFEYLSQYKYLRFLKYSY